MSVRRRTTVHDLASLRVHPDGSRVQNPHKHHIKHDDDHEDRLLDRILRPRRAHYVGQDSKGNWIAADAGGKGFVKELWSAGKRKKEEGSSDEEIAPGLHSALGSDENEDGGIGASKADYKDARAKKRRRFYEDYSFLDDVSSQAAPSRSVSLIVPPSSSAQGTSRDDMNVPSSDFLKCIHHFASNYYHDKGHLYDAGKEARVERKARKLQRQRDDDSVGSSSSSSSSRAEDDSGSEGNGNGIQKRSQHSKDKRRITRRTKQKGEKLRKDMYKVFDGSALMAVGILVQEIILEMFGEEPPDGWEEEMELGGQDDEPLEHKDILAGGKRRRRNQAQPVGSATEDGELSVSSGSPSSDAEGDSSASEGSEEIFR